MINTKNFDSEVKELKICFDNDEMVGMVFKLADDSIVEFDNSGNDCANPHN